MGFLNLRIVALWKEISVHSEKNVVMRTHSEPTAGVSFGKSICRDVEVCIDKDSFHQGGSGDR